MKKVVLHTPKIGAKEDIIKKIPKDIPFEGRVKRVFEEIINYYENLFKEVPNDDDLHIVLGPEDFLCGAKIATQEEITQQRGKCIPLKDAYRFICHDLLELSKIRKDILFVPGSMYVSEKQRDVALVTQENIRRGMMQGAKQYMQNIAPVYHGGSLIRLLKKGKQLKMTYINDRNKRVNIYVDQVSKIESILGNNKHIEVLSYKEDHLTDFDNIVMAGKTSLVSEKSILKQYGYENLELLFTPYFNIQGYDVGMEICGDHTVASMQELDIHMVSSHGVREEYYHSIKPHGYFLQADESETKFVYKVDDKAKVQIIKESNDVIMLSEATFKQEEPKVISYEFDQSKKENIEDEMFEDPFADMMM
ncbi:hypothetical protein L3V86_00620 [Thiotrichales bacterium 19S11-10]|nr:hypothetical protein [Thiotrichales bacterium 19S11-10]